MKLTVFQFCLFHLVLSLNTTEETLAPFSFFPLIWYLYKLVRFPLSLLKAEQSQLSQSFFTIEGLQPFSYLCGSSLSSLWYGLFALGRPRLDTSVQNSLTSAGYRRRKASLNLTFWQQFAWRLLLFFATKGGGSMGLQWGVHQGSQVPFTKMFSRWLALHQPHQKLRILVVPAESWRRPSNLFVRASAAVQCADLVTQPHHVVTQTLRQPVGKAPVPPWGPKWAGLHSPSGAWSQGRSLMY